MNVFSQIFFFFATLLCFVGKAYSGEQWVERNGYINQFESDEMVCLFATQIEIKSSWDAIIKWRSDDRFSKWVEGAKQNGLECGVGETLRRHRERSTKSWNAAFRGFPGLNAGYNARCENGEFDSCRGYRVAKDSNSVEVGSFKRNTLQEGVVFYRDGTNFLFSDVGWPLPSKAIFPGSEALIITSAVSYVMGYGNKSEPSDTTVFFKLTDGRVFKAVTYPICKSNKGTWGLKDKCFGMYASDGLFYFGEMTRGYSGGVPEGTGLEIKTNGQQFIGSFSNGTRHGLGMALLGKGSSEQVGFWKRGELVETLNDRERKIAEFRGFNIIQLCDLIESQRNIRARDEVTRRGLTCDDPLKSSPSQALLKNPPQPHKPSNDKLTNTEKAFENKNDSVAANSPKASDENALCKTINDQLREHIDARDYDLAGKAAVLLKQLNCSTQDKNIDVTKSTETLSRPLQRNVKKFQASQLSCSVGPLWRNKFGKDRGFFFAKSFDEEPKTACDVARSKCTAKGAAVAAKTKYSPSRNPSSYSAQCNKYGRYNPTECTVTPNNNSGGGFFGGFARGMSEAMDESRVKGDAMIAEFRLCMADEGYSLRQR